MQQRRHWNAVAGGWAAWFDWTEQNFRPVTRWFHEAAGWRPGLRILDAACGPGYPVLAAASAVCPGGTVIAIDIAEAMLTIAARKARELRLEHVGFTAMDAEALGFEDGAFDAVTNAYGLTFCSDPARAIREALRVTRPGGTFALSVWADPAVSPFFTVIHDAAAPFLHLAPLEAATPGPFCLARAEPMASLLHAAGAGRFDLDHVVMTLECTSPAQYLTIFSDLAWGSRIRSLSASDAARLQDAVEAAVQRHVENGRLRLQATSLCARVLKS